MANYIVASQNGIKLLSNGESWAKGQVIGPSGIKARVWQMWIDEGVIVEQPEEAPKPKPAKKPKATRKAKEVKKDDNA